MPPKVSEATARTAARQVWILAGISLLGGLITLAAFGWILWRTASQREEIDSLRPTDPAATLDVGPTTSREQLEERLGTQEAELAAEQAAYGPVTEIGHAF